MSIQTVENKQKEQQDQIDRMGRRMSESDDEHAKILKAMLEMKVEIISEIHSIRKEAVSAALATREYMDKRISEQGVLCAQRFISTPSANFQSLAKIGLVVALLVLFVAAGLGMITLNPQIIALLLH